MLSDGNCQFRSLSKELFRTADHHAVVREVVTSHMIRNHADYVRVCTVLCIYLSSSSFNFLVSLFLCFPFISQPTFFFEQLHVLYDESWVVWFQLLTAVLTFHKCLTAPWSSPLPPSPPSSSSSLSPLSLLPLFLPSQSPFMDGQDWTSYILHMQKDQTWGDELTLRVRFIAWFIF